MPCKPCIEKAYRRYKAHGLNDKEALRMAKKLVKRVEKRQKAEETKKEPKLMVLKVKLHRLIFETNWSASIFWKKWIGKGSNPDYTQPCTQGTCLPVDACTQGGQPCLASYQCVGGSCMSDGDCGCPSPLPNSHLSGACSSSCVGTGRCDICLEFFCSPNCGTIDCTGGTCGYDCDDGYYWNGVQCISRRQILVQVI